jgi:FkbM family methyltransferase
MTASIWQESIDLLLQGEEAEAQLCWLALLQEGAEEGDLITELDRSATQEAIAENWQNAWLLRRHLAEFAPQNLPNALQLLIASIKMGGDRQGIDDILCHCTSLLQELGEHALSSLDINILETAVQLSANLLSPSSSANQPVLEFRSACIPYYRKFVDQQPDNLSLRISLANLLAPQLRFVKLDDFDRVKEAIAHLELALPYYPELAVGLAYLHNIIGNYAEGEQYARRAIAVNRYNGVVNSFNSRTLAEALLGQRKYVVDPQCAIDFTPLVADKELDIQLPPLVGTLPTGSGYQAVVLLSADKIYFEKYAIAQALSISQTNPQLGIHFHIIDPDSYTFELLAELVGKIPFTFTYEYIKLSNFPLKHMPIWQKVYYCCCRFIRAKEISQNLSCPLIITDADCLWQNSIAELLDQDLAVALVDFGVGFPLYDRYNASFIVFNHTYPHAKLFMDKLKSLILTNINYNPVWMIDQFALYAVAEILEKTIPDAKLCKLPTRFASTDWLESDFIWNALNTLKDQDNKFTIQRDSLLVSLEIHSGRGNFNKYNQLTNAKYGMMLYNRHDLYIGKSLSVFGTWADQEIELLKQFLEQAAIVVDVGANIGSHTLAFCRIVGESGKVYSFEPQRLIYQTLVGNIALNSITNAYCYCQAVGKEMGTARIPVLDVNAPYNFGAMSLVGSTVIKKTLATEYEVVPLITLDSLDLPACHLIKADVEGMEIDVILGARETIGKYQPILFLECHDDEHRQPLIELCKELGYVTTICDYGDPNLLAIPESSPYVGAI